VAAGVLLVEEAGGFVSNFSGGSSVLFKKEIIAAHPALVREFLQRVSDKLA
jgi:myo-inositol-1(or 4)-monophosphatase